MQPRSKLPESCRRLAEVLVAAGVGLAPDGGSIVVVASRNSGEGVTTVATLLAHAFVEATGGPVMLIDAEKGAAAPGPRHPTAPSGPAADAEAVPAILPSVPVIEPGPAAGLKVIADDGALARALSLPDGREALVRGLRAAYRVVVVDAGSMRTRIPFLWSRVAHQTLLVVDTRTTTVEALTRLRAEADAADIRFTGTILNRRSFHVPRMFYSWAR